MKRISRAIGIFLVIVSLWFSTQWAVSNSFESSAEYLYEFSEIRFGYSLFFSVLFLLCTFFNVKVKNVMLLLIFTLWLISGRYFYFKEFSTCSIGTSIYFLEDNRFDLCGQPQEDYETAMANLNYQQLPFWRLRFVYGSHEKIIFIGPFAWNSTLKILLDSTMKYKVNPF